MIKIIFFAGKLDILSLHVTEGYFWVIWVNFRRFFWLLKVLVELG